MIVARRNLLAAASCTVLYAAHRRKRAICEGAELRRAPSDASARATRATSLLRLAEQEAAEAAAALAAETAAQTADAPSDVLVVGGGIVGASVAFHAARLGARVTLLEKASCGCEASGLSAGTLYDVGVPERVDASSAALYLRAGSASILEALGGCEFNRCGALDVAATPPEVKLLRQDFEAARSAGLQCSWHEAAEVHALEPALAGGSALAAVHTPRSGSVQPGLATLAFVEGAVAAGCAVREGAEVVSLRRTEAGLYEALTSEGDRLLAKQVVLAAGAWSAKVARSVGVHVPCVPVKGVVATLPAEPNALSKVIFDMESRACFAAEGDGRDDEMPAKCTHDRRGERRCRKLYGKQCGEADNHQLLFGGDRLLPDSDSDYAVPSASRLSVREHVLELLPKFRDFGPARAVEAGGGEWAGLMPFAHDGKPIVGELSRLGLDGLWLCCGFGPAGIMEGPKAAQVLAELVVEDVLHTTPRPRTRVAMADAESGGDDARWARVAMAWMDPCRAGCCVASEV